MIGVVAARYTGGVTKIAKMQHAGGIMMCDTNPIFREVNQSALYLKEHSDDVLTKQKNRRWIEGSCKRPAVLIIRWSPLLLEFIVPR